MSTYSYRTDFVEVIDLHDLQKYQTKFLEEKI